MRPAFLRQAAPEIFLDNPVDLQIRIAPYGRSEMGVVPGRQAEMPGAVRGVACLLHGAQHQTGKQRLLACALQLVEKLLQLLRMNLALLHADGVAEIIDKNSQLLHLVRIRLIVGAV